MSNLFSSRPLGWVLAPVGAGMTFLVIALSVTALTTPAALGSLLRSIVVDTSLFGIVYAAVLQLVLGLPAHLWLKSHNKRRIEHYMIAGLSAGGMLVVLQCAWAVLIVTSLGGSFHLTRDMAVGVWVSLMAIPCAFVAATMFWYISVRPSAR